VVLLSAMSPCGLERFKVKVESDACAELFAKLFNAHNEYSMIGSRSENTMQGRGRMVLHETNTKGG